MVTLDIEMLEQQLLDQQLELLGVTGLVDFDSRSVAVQPQSTPPAQALALTSDNAGEQKIRLAKIESALDRIDQGCFGVCAQCQQSIDEKTLLNDPVQDRCHRC